MLRASTTTATITGGDSPAQTFSEVALRWLDAAVATLTERTVERRRWTIKSLSQHFPQPIARITRADVERWATARSKITAPATYNKELESLRLVFEYAVEHRFLDESQASHLKRRKVPKPMVLVPSRERFKALVAELRRYPHDDQRDSKRGADLVEFLAYSGCRLGETVNLQWDDIDFSKGTLTIGR